MYHFLGGTGDCVVYPIYEALKRRGVKFNFFTKVQNLELSEDKKTITKVIYERQVDLKVPMEEYNPLYNLKIVNDEPKVRDHWRVRLLEGFLFAVGLTQFAQVWRHTPNYKQIDDKQAAYLKSKNIDLESWWARWKGAENQVLELGKDFDHVVCAISIGALPYIAKDIIDSSKRWQQMINGVDTVQTFGGTKSLALESE